MQLVIFSPSLIHSVYPRRSIYYGICCQTATSTTGPRLLRGRVHHGHRLTFYIKYVYVLTCPMWAHFFSCFLPDSLFLPFSTYTLLFTVIVLRASAPFLKKKTLENFSPYVNAQHIEWLLYYRRHSLCDLESHYGFDWRATARDTHQSFSDTTLWACTCIYC